MIGTPAYMAPEQLDGGPVDARADQYAFCAALWEALLGRRPFDGATPDEVREAIESGEPRAPRAGDARRDPPRAPPRDRRAAPGPAPRPDRALADDGRRCSPSCAAIPPPAADAIAIAAGAVGRDRRGRRRPRSR